MENFIKEIIEECKTKEELCEREKHWIKKLNSRYPIGYNISSGGKYGDTMSHNPKKMKYIKIEQKIIRVCMKKL